MENWKKDSRKDIVMVDVDALVPPDHLLRKVERVMDYDWLYERLSPYYCADNGRPGTDPVVLIKMVLIQHLFGIASLRQTYRDIQVNVAYRWFLGYSLLEEIPHFATVSYAFCKRFPPELSEEIFAHILNKALNNRMVDPSMIFIDGTQKRSTCIAGASFLDTWGPLNCSGEINSPCAEVLPAAKRSYGVKAPQPRRAVG